ncbi:glycoside hydrolase family 2 protein [Paenibacillus sinopodophylli]|uniref:glycoside hydrolase family 2 protein n=1 Tax=Paenibacillus sinopodophylli TaxID=1837342 RepID=UPI001485FB02|nr:sugar-binding domain-containing protein [Paenibacillus sinopodophylli]
MHTRITTALAEHWQFQADADGIGMGEKWFEHGLPSARSVRIPHTWNVEEGLEEYRGLAWYNCEFHIPHEYEGRIIRLQFDAVYRDSVIWVNGRQAGKHGGSGYTAFTIEISDYVVYGQSNRLVVSVSNENSETALPIRNSFDWADDGGIIRGVSMIVTGAAAIDYVKLDAIPVFTGPEHSVQEGILNGQIKLWKIPIDEQLPITVILSVWREDVLIGRERYEAYPQDGKLQLKEMRIDKPALWHFDHPNLYNVHVALVTAGNETDRMLINVGFREIRTAGHQLLLNREPVRLMGVEWMPGSHPDRGVAETEEQLIEVLEQIKHANCVITRFHWQQDSRLLDWCDRNGLLVQEEIPHWQQPAEPDESLLPLAKQHAEEMILRHYNHPSIYAWGMGNEVDGQDERTVHYMKQLKSYMLTLDEHRFINYVSNSVHFKPDIDATGTGDLLMWNDYIGTWHGDLDMVEVIQSIDNAYPDKPLIVAEYGLCEPAFTGGDERRINILQEKTEEYRKHEGIAALIFFSLNDYRTQMGEEGTGRLRQRVHGTTDLYGNPKPSYQALREIGSPIAVKQATLKKEKELSVVLSVRNDIPKHAVNGYRFILISSDGSRSEYAIPLMQPGEEYRLVITKDDVEVRPSFAGELHFDILRPTGFSACKGLLNLV